MSEKTTIIKYGHLFEGGDSDDYLRSLCDETGEWLASLSLGQLLPDEARDWKRGRFEITVKFTPAESEVTRG